MDGWLDSHQFHECVPGCQSTNQARRLLRQWQGLHRLHIMGERNTGHRRPVLQAYAHVQCLQRAQLHLLGMVHRPYAGKQDIETWRSWGEPEFYDTIYQPFFFSALAMTGTTTRKYASPKPSRHGKTSDRAVPWKSTYATTSTRTSCTPLTPASHGRMEPNGGRWEHRCITRAR